MIPPMKKLIIVALLCIASSAQAQDLRDPMVIPTDREAFYKAKVIRVVEEGTESLGGLQRDVQEVQLEIITGPAKGEVLTVENGLLNGREDLKLYEGDKVIIEEWQTLEGETQYFLREKYRLPPLVLLTVIFLSLAFFFGGRMGLQAVFGLIVSVLILALFVVPRIIAGSNPLLVSVVGSFLIAGTAIYLAHGFNKRTTIAVISTFITLAISTVLAIIFVNFAKLFGMGTEEAMFLQLGPAEHINLRGLLLGGIIIGALGVLDDITTGQTAAIDELSRANASLGFSELYRRGLSIGREHIASLVNSLALAYVGASLPLLVLFSTQRTMPLWMILNGEFVAEEIVRTLVGSSTLLVAVPISTYLAAKACANGKHSGVKGGHVCRH